MIPSSALTSSVGSGNIRKGRGGLGEMNPVCGGVRTKKDWEKDRERYPLSSFFVRTPDKLFASPCPPRTLCVFSLILRTFSPSEPFALLPLQSIMSAGCPSVRSRPLTVHPTPSPAFRTHNRPPDPLFLDSTLQRLSLLDSFCTKLSY